jgi:FKBP-type peptidyl-prolyl cis-trans isomerase
MKWFLVSALFAVAGCVNSKKATTSTANDGLITSATGLQYKILQEGKGEPAREGQEVLIFETTSYLNGTILYSNENTTNPVKVLIGGHQATDGVDEGLRGMRTGEIRRLIAPPNLVKRTIYPDNVSPDSALSIKIILHKIL